MFNVQYLIGVLKMNLIKNDLLNCDNLLPFTLEGSKIRGNILSLNNTVNKILKKHNYTKIVSLLLAETMIHCCCLGSSLKFDGKFSLQLNSKGPIKTLLADVSSKGEMRAYANYNEQELKKISSSDIENLQSVMPKGQIAFTTSFTNSKERYQSITSIIDGTFSDSILNYFENSEQISTDIKSFSSFFQKKYYSGAIFLQKMPTSNSKFEDEIFNEAKLFIHSLKSDELFSEEKMEDILYKLFNKFSIRIYKQKKIICSCSCNIEKVQNTIRQINKKEFKKLLLPDGSIEVVCEFCKNKISFSHEDLELLRNNI